MNMSKESRYQQITYAEKIYTCGFQESGTYAFQLKLLCVYLRDFLDMKPAQRQRFLIEFCQIYIPDYHRRREYQMIQKAVKYGLSRENMLIQLTGVDVYTDELEQIQTLVADSDIRKVMVAMFIKKKWDKEIFRLRHSGNEYRSYYSYPVGTKTFKWAGRAGRIAKNIDIFSDVIKKMVEKGLIRFELKDNLTLLFMKDLTETGKVAFRVTDCDCAGLYYDRYCGEKRIGICAVCGRAFWKTNNVQKYCKEHLEQSTREKKWIREFNCNVCGRRVIVSSYDTHSTRCERCSGSN